jgi:oligoribonuclease
MDKNKTPTKVLWLDLEMTGLDANNDLILEVAAEITDFEFKTIGSYEARVKHKKELVIERMGANSWWQDFPANRDDLVSFVNAHFGTEQAVLGGNSIHSDRAFIKAQWPMLDLKLHYRMLDVSSFKILMQGKYGEVFEKPEIHRAFDDIQASIAELQHYIEFMKNQ